MLPKFDRLPISEREPGNWKKKTIVAMRHWWFPRFNYSTPYNEWRWIHKFRQKKK
jgi:hypothetical protein